MIHGIHEVFENHLAIKVALLTMSASKLNILWEMSWHTS